MSFIENQAPSRQFEPVTAPGANQGVIAYFHDGYIDDTQATLAQGRPIKKTVPFCRIQFVGDRLNIHDQPASNEDIGRFPQQWAQYKQGREQIPDGTPISALYPNDPGLIENLRFVKVFTVEQLAEAGDAALQGIGMGARTMQQKAKAFMDVTERSKVVNQMEAAAAKQSTDMDVLKQRIAALEAALTAQGKEIPETHQPRKPGRPKKTPAQ